MNTALKKTRYVSAFALCLLAALALCMDFMPRELSKAAQDSGILSIIEGVKLSLDGTLVETTIITLALFSLWRWVQTHRSRGYVLLPIVSALVALIWLMAEGYEIDHSLQYLHSDMGQIAKSGIYFLGMSFLLSLCGEALDVAIEQGRDLPAAKEGRVAAFWHRHSFLAPFLALLGLSIIPLILCYPGIVSADSWNQIGMYFGIVRPDWGIYPFTSHYPPAHTVLFASIIALGRHFGSAQLGLFMASCLWNLLYALSFAYALHAMSQMKAPRWLYWASFVLFAFDPYMVYEYAGVSKDGIYGWAILIFVVELCYMLRLGWGYWQSKSHMAVLAAGIMMSVLMRNNGIYVILPMALLLVLLGLINRKKGKGLARLCGGVLLPLLLALLINKGLMLHFDVEKGSIREALSMPIQQTARYVKHYGDEVTAEERAAISAVLDYENMAQDYYPMESDPVKDKWSPEAGTKELVDYLKAWASMGLKHPFVYIQATVEQNYPVIFPFREGPPLGTGTLNRHHLVAAEELGISDGDVMPRVNNIRNGLNGLLFYLPFTGLAFAVPLAVLGLLALCCFALSRRRWNFFVVALPLLLSLGIVILSPGIAGNPRYAYPILYAFPSLLACWWGLMGHWEKDRD